MSRPITVPPSSVTETTQRPLTPKQKGELYTQFLPMATMMANKFAKRYGRNFPDLMDEAQSILATVVSRWDSDDPIVAFDPKRCKITSWIYRALYWDLSTFCTRKRDKAFILSTLEKDEKPMQVPAPKNWLQGVLADLGDDARELVRTLVMAPAELAEAVSYKAKNRTVKAVRAYLSDVGWSDDRMDAAWAEVTSVICDRRGAEDRPVDPSRMAQMWDKVFKARGLEEVTA